MRSAVYVFSVNEMNTLNGLMRHDEVVSITSHDWHAIAVNRTFFSTRIWQNFNSVSCFRFLPADTGLFINLLLVKPRLHDVVKPVEQSVVSCIQTFNRLSNWLYKFNLFDSCNPTYQRFKSLYNLLFNRFNNWLNNRLHRVNGVRGPRDTALNDGRGPTPYNNIIIIQHLYSALKSCKGYGGAHVPTIS